MTLAVLLTRAAERHALIECHVIADDSGLSDDDAITVVDKEILADLRARVDFDACLAHGALRDPPRPEIMSAEIELMRDAIMQHDLKARIEEHLHVRVYRRVTLANDLDFVFDAFDKTQSNHLCFFIAIIRKRINSSLRDEFIRGSTLLMG